MMGSLRWVFRLILGIVLVWMVGSLPAAAQQTTYEVQATYLYGERLRFSITGERPTLPDELVLTVSYGGEEHLYNTGPSLDGQGFRGEVTITPGEIELGPVGTVVYWWQIGEGEQTNIYTMAYEDNTLPWDTSADSRTHAISLMADSPRTHVEVAVSVNEAIAAGEELLGVGYTGRIQVWVYPNTQMLIQTLERHNTRSTDWIGAYALPDEQAILVTEDNLEADIRHEVAHVMLGQALGEGYEHLPGWLNEGVALVLQPEGTGPDFDPTTGRLPLEGLCGPSLAGFTAADAVTAYGQSESVVRYIIATYPPDALPSLIQRYANGAGCTEGIEMVLGQPFAQFERDWFRWATSQEGATSTVTWNGLWLLLIVITAGVATLFIGPQVRGRPR